MAGRGVDIKLGEGVLELGGLYVLGTERHEARRIDNQLRGRSGRQGDPGESRFYLSAQDNLVRLFAGDRIYRIIDRFKIPDDQPMEAKILSKQIENAQKKVEEQNFVSRKNVLKYDDVMNKQRVVIYEQRRQVLEGEDLSEEVTSWLDEVIEAAVEAYVDPESSDIDLDALTTHMQQLYGSEITPDELREDGITERSALVEEFIEDAREEYAGKEEELGSGPDARARALRDPPGRRHPLARAPREHGLPPRGRAPAGDGAEGPARRVHLRGSRDVPGAERGDPRGGAGAPLPRPARAGGCRGAAPHAGGAGRRGRERWALVRARVRRRRRRDRGRRGGRRRYGGRGGGGRHRGAAAAAGRRRAPEARPERALLVRVGQEVQEVPRRLTAPSPPLVDDVVRLEPLAARFAPEFDRLLRDPEIVRHTRVPTTPPAGFAATWVDRYVAGWIDGTRAGFAILSVEGDDFLGMAALVDLDLPARQAEIGYLVAPEARGRGVASRALGLITDWSLRSLGLERVELRIDVANAASIRVAERLGYVREGVLRSLHLKEDLRSDVAIYSRLAGDRA